MSKDTGGPAFPIKNPQWLNDGMTKRDYFAAKAITSVVLFDAIANSESKNFKYTTGDSSALLAKTCYAIADAMLKERDE